MKSSTIRAVSSCSRQILRQHHQFQLPPTTTTAAAAVAAKTASKTRIDAAICSIRSMHAYSSASARSTLTNSSCTSFIGRLPTLFSPLSHHHISITSTTTTTTTTTSTSNTTIQTRNMGIRTKAKNRSKPSKSSKQKTPKEPINEHLIRTLLKQQKQKTAETVQVRLLLDQGRDAKPTIEIVSLSQAIQISADNDVDLVGINLTQDIPVVKCVDYNKFLYQQSKKSSTPIGSTASSIGSGSTSTSTGGDNSGGKKSTKQFSFRAGIDDNDLQRKATNMIQYLLKGHACQVTITSNRRNLRSDGNVMVKTLERLKEIVGEDGSPQGGIKINEYGNRGTLLFQPNSKRVKQQQQ